MKFKPKNKVKVFKRGNMLELRYDGITEFYEQRVVGRTGRIINEAFKSPTKYIFIVFPSLRMAKHHFRMTAYKFEDYQVTNSKLIIQRGYQYITFTSSDALHSSLAGLTSYDVFRDHTCFEY